jgi:hypothetical protein
MEFKVTAYFTQYKSVNDQWQEVEIKHVFVVNTWDDFNNLIDTLLEASLKPIKFETELIKTEEEA